MRIRSSINVLLFLSGIGILGLMVILAGPSRIWDASKRANLKFIISGLLVFALYLFVRSLRWHVMLKVIRDDGTGNREQGLGIREFVPVYFLSFMISNVTPARSGEALAPFLMKRHVGQIETGMGFSVVLVDRILDVLFTVGMAILGFIYCAVFAVTRPAVSVQSLNIVFYPAIAILIALTGMMVMVALWEKGAFAFLTAFTSLFFRSRQRQLLEGLSSFYKGLRTVRERKVMPRLFAYVILSWLLLAISYFLRVRAVLYSPLLPIMSCWIVSLCIGMASFIPSGLGSSQASFAYLISFMGCDFADAAAAALLAKFVALGVIFTLGLGSLFWIRQ